MLRRGQTTRHSLKSYGPLPYRWNNYELKYFETQNIIIFYRVGLFAVSAFTVNQFSYSKRKKK